MLALEVQEAVRQEQVELDQLLDQETPRPQTHPKEIMAGQHLLVLAVREVAAQVEWEETVHPILEETAALERLHLLQDHQ
jgi:hypothetical protein